MNKKEIETNKIRDIINDAIVLLKERTSLNYAENLYTELINFDQSVKEFNEKFFNLKYQFKNNINIIQEFDEAKMIQQTFENLLETVTKFNNYIKKIIDFCWDSDPLSSVQKQEKEFINALLQARLILLDIRKITFDLENMIRSSKLRFNTLTSTRNQRRRESFIESIISELNNFMNFINILLNILEKIISDVKLFLHSDRKSKRWNIIALTFAKFLEGFIYKGIWTYELISYLTGLRNIAGEFGTQEVAFRISGKKYEAEDDTPRGLSLDALLARYPPFEPIHDEVNGIIGGNVWFIKSYNVFFYPIPRTSSKEIIIRGRCEEHPYGVKLLEVETINLMFDEQLSELVVRVDLQRIPRIATIKAQARTLWIKYGSRKLREKLAEHLSTRRSNIKQILDDIQINYASQMEKLKRKAYKVNDLGYVWYCTRGYAMSTDPYDYADCPFKGRCYLGNLLLQKGKKTCPNWSKSRRLFPKVYVESERRTSSRNLDSEARIGLFTPVVGRRIGVIEHFTGAQWFMPSIVSTGNLVRIEFTKPIIKTLPNTNAIGFSLSLSLIKSLLSQLVDESVTPKPKIPLIITNSGIKLEITLDKLMLSKFLIYEFTGKGFNQLGFLQLTKERIIKEASILYENMKQNKEIVEEFLDYLVHVFAHTLSHLFYSFLSSALEIEPENISYLYIIDKESDRLYILVYENSPYGAIDLPSYALRHFNSYQKMLERFLSFTDQTLENHERDLIEYKRRSLAELTKKSEKEVSITSTDGREIPLSSIAKELEDNWYIPLVEENIVMDPACFTYHLILSEAYRKVVEKYHVKEKELERQLESIVRDYTGIIHCIDGCTACVILDHGCFNPLIQNLTTSRNLTKWLLRVLTGRETVHGRGSSLIEPLFSIASKEIIVLSPYVDEEGVELLKKAASRGVKVILLTREENIRRYERELSRHGIGLLPVRERHDKYIVIDDELVVETSQNLAGLHSINMFRILKDPEKAKTHKAQLLQTGYS